MRSKPKGTRRWASCSNFEVVAPFLKSAVDAHVALYDKTEATAPWIAYLARLTATRELVGICSFKDKCRAGRVEIAYFSFPSYQGRGFGTQMARQLVNLAARHPDVVDVIAHTLPEEGPSTRILRGLKFKFLDEVLDPEDGRIWQWLLQANATRRTTTTAKVPMSKAMAVLSLLMRSAAG